MSIRLFDAMPSLINQGCPRHVVENAIDTSRQIANIVWDDPDTPEHCRGFVQWSARPFRVTDRCDGTSDSNALLVCNEFCARTGIDLSAIYESAYPDEHNPFSGAAYLDYLESHRPFTEVPPVNQDSIIQLLNCLYSILLSEQGQDRDRLYPAL